MPGPTAHRAAVDDNHLGQVPASRRYYLPSSFTPFLPATVFRGPLRVRALERVRWPRTGSERRVARAAITIDIAKTPDVLLNLPPQRAFNQEVLVDQIHDLSEFLFRQVFGAALRVNIGGLEDLAAVSSANAKKVSQAHPDRLVTWISTPAIRGILAPILDF